MKTTINGKRYNTDTCEDLGHRAHYNNGNHSGSTYLLRAKDGTFLEGGEMSKMQAAIDWIDGQDTKCARTLRERAKYLVAATLPRDIPPPVVYWDVLKIASGMGTSRTEFDLMA